MIVPFFPRITGVVVAPPWTKEKNRVNCVAHLTRSLTAAEAGRLEQMLDVQVEGNRLRYSCRAAELEEEEERILVALARAASPRRKRGRRGNRARQ